MEVKRKDYIILVMTLQVALAEMRFDGNSYGNLGKYGFKF